MGDDEGNTASECARIGDLRAKAGDDVGALVAFETAVAHDHTHPGWHARIGDLRAKAGDDVGALAAFETAISIDDTRPRWHARIAQLYERQAEWWLAAAAHLRVLDHDPNYRGSLLGLGRAARRLVRRESTPEARDLLTRAFELAHGAVALDRFLEDRYGERATHVRVESNPILAGEGSAHLLEHTLVDAQHGTSERVVQKVPSGRREIAVLEQLQQVQHQSRPEVSFPRILALMDINDVTHVFLEYVDYHKDSHYPVDQLERIGAILAKVPSVLPVDVTLTRAPPPDYSATKLRETCKRIRRSQVFEALCASDPSAEDDLRTLELEASLVADAAEALPNVFSHNDTGPSNVVFRRDEAGDICSGMFLDWGLAGPNLVGAELHWLLSFGGLTDGEIRRVVDRYHESLERAVPGLDRDEILFGASLHSVVRLVWVFERSSTSLATARQVVAMARLAVELAGESTGPTSRRRPRHRER